MSNTYYQDELRFLREVGPEFARLHPEVARFLADRGSDPDVERMLEGVAFLTGRIRQKLDDELPEITGSLMSLLWPHYLRPIPSMSILEYQPDIDGMQGTFAVNAGAEFSSVPVDGTQCTYRACWNTRLRPWRIREVQLESSPAKPVRLILKLQAAPKAKIADLELGRLRLHLAGDLRTAFALYYLLAAHCESVTISDGSTRHDRAEELLGPEAVRTAGLSRHHATIPYPQQSFAGYRLLQEYFAFRERFLFVDVMGIDRAVERLERTSELGTTLEMAFQFKGRLENYPLVGNDNVRLHCTPIINLFTQPAEPIRIKHDRVRYLIQPSKVRLADRRHAEIYSVDEVAGLARLEGLESRVYEPFYSFSHVVDGDPRSATYYQVHLTPSVLSSDRRHGTDTFVSFVVGGKVDAVPAEETISLELTCTNRDLPLELRAGDISEPTDNSPQGVRFRNIVKPTSTVSPPVGKSLHWRLISHMALNYVSLMNLDRFKELLRIYDFESEYDRQKALTRDQLLAGVVNIEARFEERMVRGAPLRGMCVTLSLNEDAFAGEGDAYLFATIVDRFLSLYVTLNSFSQLSVIFTRNNDRFDFEARYGEQPTPVEHRELEREDE